MNLSDLSTPLELSGRPTQFQRIVQVLARDGDLLIAGVPGSGRRTLVRQAVREVSAIALEVDCIRATDGERFVQLLCEAINLSFQDKAARLPSVALKRSLIQNWITVTGAETLFVFEEESGSRLRLMRVPSGRKAQSFKPEQLAIAFKSLLELPQLLGESLEKQVVLILHSFPHIRSWDRHGEWESVLRQKIKDQTHVSYVLIATIAETSIHPENAFVPLEIVQLAPLSNEFLAIWAREILHTQGLTFDSRSPALDLFLEAVQGHVGDAMTLIRSLITLRQPDGIIRASQVREAIQGLLKSLSITFESLLMLLPANQVHLLESLALDPTEKPQSREYINRHGLSRGGSLQGALSGLQHKGLIYGSEEGYRLALPLLSLWIRQRLT